MAARTISARYGWFAGFVFGVAGLAISVASGVAFLVWITGTINAD
jgi:hypothetical protein